MCKVRLGVRLLGERVGPEDDTEVTDSLCPTKQFAFYLGILKVEFLDLYQA